MVMQTNKPQSVMEAIILNVSGKQFLVKRETLQRYPGTRLANLGSSSPEYDPQTKDYYFDRNPKIVPFIIDLYRTGELHLPPNLCPTAVKEELLFWDIAEDAISECCWKAYFRHNEDMRIFDVIRSAFSDMEDGRDDSLKQKIWLTMSNPDYSSIAKVYHIINIIFIMTAVFVFCLFTHPTFRQTTTSPSQTPSDSNKTSSADVTDILSMITFDPHPVLMLLDINCLVFFTITFILQIVVCPSKKKFLFQFLNIVELILLVDMWVVMMCELFYTERRLYSVKVIFYIMRFGFGLRVFRMFHLALHYKIMQILYLTLRGSLRHMLLLIVALSMAVIIFATLMFVVETSSNVNTFPSIPDAIWWAIITMTTIGYGDLVPKSSLGRVVGSVCAVTGLLIIALPIAIIASSFNSYNDTMEARDHSIRRQTTIYGKKNTGGMKGVARTLNKLSSNKITVMT